MREKAAARKKLEMAAKEKAMNASQQKIEKVLPTQNMFTAEAAKEPVDIKVAEASEEISASHQTMPYLKPKTPESIKEQDAMKELKPQVASPMDTYEISDREDSDSESESESEEEDERNPRKKVR